ncbi:unnamed protein product [Discula destructiva]
MGSIQNPDSFDIVIVGAGLAGINCAYRLQTRLPHAKITILEGRHDIGGTWDLFKYPGIRSDSDLYTYGFAWEPWPYDTPIAEGPLILSYLHTCVDKYGLRKYLNFRHKVIGGDWSSESKRWTLTVDHEGEKKLLDTSFVVLSTGYYDYDTPLPVTIPGIEKFQGKVIHPQFWPTDFDFTDKEVVVIGSGATAITLIPNLAPKTKHVTMLQRSPSYIVPFRNQGIMSNWSFVPKVVKEWLNWIRASTVPQFKVMMCRRYPEKTREAIIKLTGEQLPPNVSTDPHFTPRYKPWDQRLCLSPDGDFFQSLHGKDGQPAKASVVTAKIETVTEDAIVCEDGQVLKTDVIVTATGLKMTFGGGIHLRVDGERVDPHEHAIWDGCMLNDVPNLAFMFGYATASWTVGVDNSAIMVCRLLNGMKKRGQEVAVPKLPVTGRIEEEDRRPFLQLTSTYIKRDTAYPFNIAGGTGPWNARGFYWRDWLHARFGRISKALALS